MKKTITRTARAAFATMAGISMLGAACARNEPDTGMQQTTPSGQVITQPVVPIKCETQPGSEPLPERTSPFDSTRFTLRGQTAQICYSRPSAKGRIVFGGLLPYGKLWRTGANEPTILHLPFAAEIAGIRTEPGLYSIYTVPDEKEWTIIVNRSISQWGHESQYKPDIQAQEVGRGTVPSEHLDDLVETFTIRAEPAGTDVVNLVLEWERTRVRVPVRVVGG